MKVLDFKMHELYHDSETFKNIVYEKALNNKTAQMILNSKNYNTRTENRIYGHGRSIKSPI